MNTNTSLNLVIDDENTNKEYLLNKYNSNDNPYINDDNVGFDLYQPEDVIIKAKESKLIDLDIRGEVVDENNNNYGYMLLPRSSLCLKKQIILGNSVGIIDPNYRGIIKAAVYNLSEEDQILEKGNRYFQLVFVSFFKPKIKITEKLSETSRGDGSFGSTGN